MHIKIEAVYNRLQIEPAEMAEYIRDLHEDEYPLIEELIASAKRMADKFMQNPFVDTDGAPLEEIPEDVKLGVMKLVAKFYEVRTAGLSSRNIQGVGSQTWDLVDADVRRIWIGHRMFPWEHFV